MANALAGESRVWIIKGGAGPAATVEYHGCAKLEDPSWGLGSIEKSECPDPEQANAFLTDREWRTARERVTTGLSMHYPRDLSELLALAREGCEFDIHILWGLCREKNNYLPPAWDHIDAYPAAAIETWSAENYGALSSEDQSAVNEKADVTARELYQIGRLAFSEQLASTIAREIVAVDVCDSAGCGGDCGAYSNGCSKVFAVQLGTGATPGTKPSVAYISYKRDGTTDHSGSTDIDTMFSNETPVDGKCMGGWFVVPASTSNSIHYAKSDDILHGVETWYESITGFVAGGTPEAIAVADSNHAWIVGVGGYIYFLENPDLGVTVQSAGSVTAQTLYDVHALDTQHVVAVGGSNAVVYTVDGLTWVAATGPRPGIQLDAVWAWAEGVWLVGTHDGLLYYTLDSGVSWTNIALPGSLTTIYDIQFSMDGRIGYVTGITNTVGKILRSTAGGAAGTWYVLPEGPGNIGTPGRINQIAVCNATPNTIYAGGLALASTDGWLTRGTA